MILLKKELKTAYNEIVGAGSKMIPFANILDEIYSWKYDLQVYSENTENYLKSPPIPAIVDDYGKRLAGENWQSLTAGEIEEIQNKIYPSLTEMEHGLMRFGWLARYVYKHIIAHVRERLGYWSVYEERFERYFEDAESVEIEKDFILDRILFTNDTEKDQGYSVTFENYSVGGNLKAGESIELIIETLSTGSYLTIESELKSKTLAKYYDLASVPEFPEF